MLKKFGHVSGRWGGLTSKKLAASATEGGMSKMSCRELAGGGGGAIYYPLPPEVVGIFEFFFRSKCL